MTEGSPSTPASGAPETGDTASFGFRTVAAGEKARLVQGVFQGVAAKYDLMNDAMSGGVHRLWKGAMMNWLNPQPGWSSLDVAGGTGDIAFRILERTGGGAAVTVCDLTENMLRVGRDRAVDRGLLGGLTWVTGNAETLPFPDKVFDSYTIAFGIRNVTRIDQALKEAARVLKPGGRFLCLEFSSVTVPGLDKLYDLYSFNVIPKLGRLIAGDEDSYRYLVESIRRFPDQQRFAAMIGKAGFSQVQVRNLSGGIAALHSARVF